VHQVLEARIRTQGIETGIDLQQDHPLRALAVSGFQPIEGFFFFAECGVDSCKTIGRYISLLRELMCSSGSCSLRLATGGCIRLRAGGGSTASSTPQSVGRTMQRLAICTAAVRRESLIQPNRLQIVDRLTAA
jgi:hypothetical protein